jgi:hypothetical protein
LPGHFCQQAKLVRKAERIAARQAAPFRRLGLLVGLKQTEAYQFVLADEAGDARKLPGRGLAQGGAAGKSGLE